VPSVRYVFALLALFLSGPGLAQSDDPARADTVSWSAQAVTKAGRSTLTVNAKVQPGWHVFALKQAAEGPTPLLAALEANSVATANGAVSSSPAITFRDPAFGLNTQYYEKAFSVTIPVKLKPHLSGPQTIPVSVRFQTCNGRVCQPPKTVHLSAPLDPAGG